MKAVVDIGAFALNVLSSVCIVFVNKLLMGSKGYAFGYAVTLSGLHFLTAAAFLTIKKKLGYMQAEAGKMPPKDLWTFVGTACVSIFALNTSLMVNSVGFYQMAKLLVIPFVCLVEKFWLGREFSKQIIGCIAVVAVGVGIVTLGEVQDLSTSFLGLNLAALSVVGSGMQQILCAVMQKRLSISSTEMLLATAWPQGFVLVAGGPVIDYMITGSWVLNYPFTPMAVTVIVTTCLIAILVNISQFMCLGRFSAVAYQVMGHMKTVLVLIGGAVLFGDIISSTKGMGMLLAVSGMVGYGYYSSQQKSQPPPSKDEEVALSSAKLLVEEKDKGPLSAMLRSSAKPADEQKA